MGEKAKVWDLITDGGEAGMFASETIPTDGKPVKIKMIAKGGTL